MRKLRTALWILIILALFLVAGALGFARWVHHSYASRIFNSAANLPDNPESRVAIVFGAGVWRGNRPSPVLYDRIETAAELYRAGKVKKLLMTGDNRFLNYNEPAVMRETALNMGIPDADIVLDFAGRRTYDSCYRAKEIFGVKQAVLVTQAYHLDRAMYLCNGLGLDSVGVVADDQDYQKTTNLWSSIREIGAVLMAWIDLRVLRPEPVMGDKLPIGF